MINKDLKYLDNLTNLRYFYISLIKNISNSNDVFDIIYLEKMMGYIIPNGKLDIETLKKIKEKVEYLSNEMSKVASKEDDTKENYDDKNIKVSEELEGVKNYHTFLALETKSASYSINNRIEHPIYGVENVLTNDEILLLIDERVDNIIKSDKEYKVKRLVKDTNK